MSGITHTNTTEWRKATQDKLTIRAMKQEVLQILSELGRSSEFMIDIHLGKFYKKDITRFLPGILDQLVREKMVIRDIDADVETTAFGKVDLPMYSLPHAN